MVGMTAGPRRRSARGAASAALVATLVVAGSTVLSASGASAAAATQPTPHATAPGTTTTVPTTTTFPPDRDAGSGQGAYGIFTSPFEDAVAPTFPAATSLANAERWVRAALEARSTRLDALAAAVAGSKSLPTPARAALAALLATDSTGINGLATDLAGATSLQALDAIASSMIDEYRVFVVVTPLVRSTVTAYDQLATVTRIQGLEPSIEAAITTEQQGRASVTRAQLLYRELVAELSTVAAVDQVEAAAVLALHVSSYPATTTVLATASAALASASERLYVARADVRRIVKLLAAPGLTVQRRPG